MIRLLQRRLIIPRGDTGSFSIPVIAAASNSDVAIFTIFDELTRAKIFQKQMVLSGETLTLEFTHNDTVNLKPGKYSWDIKFYKNPQYIDGELVNGDEIDSYYAGYTIPDCEIRETGDQMLVSEDAPTAALSSGQLNIVTALMNELSSAVEQTETNVSHYPIIQDGVWYTWDASNNEYVSTNNPVVTSVAGKNGDVILDGGDIAYSYSSAYPSGTIGENMKNLDDSVFELSSGFNALGANTIPYDSTDVESATIKDAIDAIPVENGSAAGAVQTKKYIYNNRIREQKASGIGAFAEGFDTKAIGMGAHAEGQGTTACSDCAHAEGALSVAISNSSHAEGYHTLSYNPCAHAEGEGTFSYCVITGEENSLTYSCSFLNDTIHVNNIIVDISTGQISTINSIDRVNNTITLARTLGEKNNSGVYIYKAYAQGEASHCEGFATTAVGLAAHAEGNGSIAKTYNSHAEGSAGAALGNVSHAEGTYTVAAGHYSHTQNNHTFALGRNAHAQNIGESLLLKISGEANTTTYSYTSNGDPEVGDYIVAYENYAKITSVDITNKQFTVNSTLVHYFNQEDVYAYKSGAFGDNSHVEGKGTTAMGETQHVQGKYNILDNNNTYEEIVGNGTSHTNRSNARTLDWSGNEALAGNITLGMGTADEVTLSASGMKNMVTDVGNLKTQKVDKDALDNAGITTRTYTELFNGEFTVTTAESQDYISPHAKASVTGRFDKTYSHRVTVNGVEYILATRLWMNKEEGVEGFKIYEYLGNLALFIDDVTGVPGGTDNVPFIIVSDYDGNSGIDVLTSSVGTYAIKVERINTTQTEIPTSLIYGDSYRPILTLHNNGTYDGLSIGVNELNNTRATTAVGYANRIDAQFGIAIGCGNIVSGVGAIALGLENTPTGLYAIAAGMDCVAAGANSHAEGNYTKATGGNSHAEGTGTEASGNMGSHAEGFKTTASGMMSHSEGAMTSATGLGSHAEGQINTASGANAHAEGNATTASGSQSHSAGNGTIANHLAQLAYGQYNVADTSNAAATARGTYVEIVGNGTADNARSNARTLDWSGNERLAGSLTLGADTQAETILTANKLGEVINYDTVIAPREADLTAASQAYAIGDVFMANGKLCAATAVIALGDAINIGTNCEYTSVAEKFVKNTDIAGINNYGVVKVKNSGGTAIDSVDKTLIVCPASTSHIKAGISTYMPITPIHQHESVFYGLTKAAGIDMASSNNAVGTYTDAAKVAIQKMLGVYEAPWELIREDTFTNAEEAHHEITLDSEGNTFELTDAIIMFETPKQDTYAAKGAYGQIEFYYGNGSGNKYTSESGAWTQEANGSAHGFVAIYEQKNGLISLSFTANTTSSNRSNISYRYSAGFPSEGAQTISIPDSNTYPRNIIKVKITAVTGTGHYKLYGKRKWTT